MTKNWIVVNVVLLIISCLLGWQVKMSVDRFNAANDLGKISPLGGAKQKLTLEAGIPPLQPPRAYNAAEFAAVPSKNVFSETRAREETEQQVAQVPESPPLAQKPIYVGVTIFENQRMASIIDPTNAGGRRKTQTRRIGDVYQGYTITDINESQMILENGNRREILPLHDGAKRSAQGGKTPILATRIVAIGGAAGGGAPTPPGAVSRPGGPASTVIGGAGQRTTANPPAGIRPVSPQVQQQGAAGNPNEGVDAQGRRVIRTPFGDIVRDK
jgi:hypothetical protein